uniref:Putative caspase apoptotic cysteine protease n=1 Tax=Rhipicephalus pulchellus TaxID=72859 RepID=L7LY79_RHIPC
MHASSCVAECSRSFLYSIYWRGGHDTMMCYYFSLDLRIPYKPQATVIFEGSNNSEIDARSIFGGIPGMQSAPLPHGLHTSLEAEEYNMSHCRRGKCVIFNYRTFERHTGLSERVGTDKDDRDLHNCFRRLGFDTFTYNNLTCKETQDTLKTLGKGDYSEVDCFVCCVLTHGGPDILYATDGKFPVSAVMEPFHDDVCPSLLGKPKLFFIQACRGDRLDSGTKAVLDTADSSTGAFCIPTHADILVAYSTVPGFYAWRNKLHGTWFIQALCQMLQHQAHFAHLLSMLTVVCRRVALDYESYTLPRHPERHGKKQVPFITSTLTRLVYFRTEPGRSAVQRSSPSPFSNHLWSHGSAGGGEASSNSEIDARRIYGGINDTQSTPPPRVLLASWDAEEYYMSHRRRGKCIIFNYRHFESHTKLCERTGADLDADNLENCFRHLGFKVLKYTDLSCKDTRATLKTLGKHDYSEDDCFVCCFLTHGKSEALYGTDGKFPIDDIMEPFHSNVCPSLLGKPKLFFIQASRGDRLDSGAGAVFDTADSSAGTYHIHTHADILTAYSTVPGFHLWEDTPQVQCSWFIKALCSVLQEQAHSSDLLSMLTVVSRRVALDYESYMPEEPEKHCKKQVPFFTSTLTRLVFFRAKPEAASS